MKADAWNDRYASDDYIYGVEPNDFLKEMSGKIPAKSKVLCLAEGEGRNAVYLAKLGHDVLAVDQSQVGLDKALQLAKKNNVRVNVQCVDLEDFVFEENTYGAIVSVWCHVPPTLRKKIHEEVHKSLVSGGVFILEAYNPKQINYKTGGPPTTELMMVAEDVKKELLGINVVLAKELEREVQEGAGHSGLSAVTQVLATK